MIRKFISKPWLLNTVIVMGLLAFGLITAQFRDPAPQTEFAQYQREEILQARVIDVTSTEQQAFGDTPLLRQVVNLEITSGAHRGQTISDVGYQANPHLANQLSVNDRVLLGMIAEESGTYYYVIDHYRLPTVMWLAGLLLLCTLVVLRKHTLPVLIAMGVSFYIVLQFMIPYIAAGNNPLLISFIGLAVIIPSTFYLVHGFQLKTTMAVVGTLISLCLVALLAIVVLNTTKLTGITNDEALTLFAVQEQQISLRSLLLAGILIGILGVLDDVTITQASIVHELSRKQNNSPLRIFHQAMNVGRDHIASAINTLILVYAGAALPTLILLMKFPRPFIVTLNDEGIMLEIILALLGTIALVVAIPITTFLSVYTLKLKDRKLFFFK